MIPAKSVNDNVKVTVWHESLLHSTGTYGLWYQLFPRVEDNVTNSRMKDSILRFVFHYSLFNEVERGVYWYHLVRLSVRQTFRQKNNRTSQKNYYQHSRNFWNFLFLLIIPITQASRCTLDEVTPVAGGWHFIAATAIKPPKAACQFAADDILLYEFCYYNPMDLLHHLEKEKKNCHHYNTILSLHISYQDITRRVC